MDCHCGRPLHYADPRAKALIDDLVKEQGEFIRVIVENKGAFMVQRHYVALHGLKAAEIEKLGFKKVE